MEIPGYRIERLIAEGGMSSVYLAMQESLGRCVALKLLKTFDSCGHTKRFLCEARTIAALEHNNIITIHDVGVVGEQHYIAMEYLEGGSLRERIDRGMQTGDALDLLERMAACLDYVHRRDVIHRDIKPSNILFHADGTPKLTDFGIAVDLDGDQGPAERGRTFGSPFYLSPEQADGRPADGRADIYAMGIMFFEMLTGRQPYAEDSHIETILAHLSQPIPLLPNAQAGYQRLLERMIAKRPDDRIASAEELLDEIGKARKARRSLRVESIGHLGRVPAVLGSGFGLRLPHAPLTIGIAGAAAIGLVLVIASGKGPARTDSPGDAARVASAPGPAPEPLDAEFATNADPASPVVGLAARSEVPELPIAEPVSARDSPEVLPAPATVPAGAAAAGDTFGLGPGLAEAAGDEVAQLVVIRSVVTSNHATGVRATRNESAETTGNAAEHAATAAFGRVGHDHQAAGPVSAKPLLRVTAVSPGPGSPADANVGTGSPKTERAESPEAVEAPAEAQPDTDDAAALVAARMADGDRALKALRLTTPAGDNAYDHFARVLVLDPSHTGARRGMDRIADYYAALARKALDKQDFRRARLYVRRGRTVRRDHAGLGSAARAIEEARREFVSQPVNERVVAAPPAEPEQFDRHDTKGTGNLFKDLGNVWHSIFD